MHVVASSITPEVIGLLMSEAKDGRKNFNEGLGIQNRTFSPEKKMSI